MIPANPEPPDATTAGTSRDEQRVYNHGPRRAHASRVLEAFGHTRRYVDDLAQVTSGSAEFVGQFLYADQVTEHGIHGIYPSALRLEPTFAEPAASMEYMDLRQPVVFSNGDFGPLQSRLRDQRRIRAFRGISVPRFSHVQSMLSSSCKYGVLGSRFVYLSRTITDVRCLIREVADLVVEMVRERYDLGRLQHDAKRFAKRLAVHYGLPFCSRSRRRYHTAAVLQISVYRAIKAAVRRRLS